MKRCNDCKRKSPDTALFCHHCAASFDLRLCPRLHPNLRDARYCTHCGSEELSRPHHIPSLDLRFLLQIFFILFLIGIAAVYLLFTR